MEAPKKKRGRPRKVDLPAKTLNPNELPGAPTPIASRPPEYMDDKTATNDSPQDSNWESPPKETTPSESDPLIPPPLLTVSNSLQPSTSASGLPSMYPDPYMNSVSPTPADPQGSPEFPVAKRRRGRPPKILSLDKNSWNSKKVPQDHLIQRPPSGMGSTGNHGEIRPQDTKRPRGRPRKNKEQIPAFPAGGSVCAGGVRQAFPVDVQVLHVQPEEDVAKVVISFCKNANHSMCVLSASGAVSHIELKHELPSRGGSTVYQGLREILSMSGYFTPLDGENHRSRRSRLNVSLVDSEGRMIGGGVSDSMIAASKVQVILGSYPSEERHMQEDSV